MITKLKIFIAFAINWLGIINSGTEGHDSYSIIISSVNFESHCKNREKSTETTYRKIRSNSQNLICAAYMNDARRVKRWLNLPDTEIDIHARDYQGLTALHKD
jgi:hypothetical protein